MDAPVLGAIIAAGASLAVSLVTLWSSRRTARIQEEFSRKLETLRLAQEASTPARDAANSAWTQLQIMKQSIDILLVDNHPETEDAVAALSAASSALQKTFAEFGPELPRDLRSALHGIKNNAHDADEKIREYKEISRYNRNIPEDEKMLLLALRKGLTRSQEYLVKALETHKAEVQKTYADLLRPGVDL